ncbi:HupE/UreJ family protein [Paenibacillus chartarius]|uniref:HupE/UreJ family protein n=1 Tax=Paenibacillus chartarius TaxID=747481 RepID=A0ABV6DLR6_9BACL
MATSLPAKQRFYTVQALCAVLLLCIAVLARPVPASAHPLNNGYSLITIEGRHLRYDLFLPEPSLLMFDTRKDERLSENELAEQRDGVAAFLEEGLQLSSEGDPLDFELASFAADDKEGIPGYTFHLNYVSEHPIEQLHIDYELLFDETDPQHVNFTVIVDGDDVDQAVFDTLHRTYVFTALGGGGLAGDLLQYGWLGVIHIALGYDHLLFLLCLLLICSGWRDAMRIVTAFTLAHSITLGLSAAGFIELGDRWVESGIAMTIAYVAAENLWLYRGRRLDAARSRSLLTVIFGLVHGLGFAGALQEIGLPKDTFLASLLAFNLGIEAGQLALAALALPLLLRLRTYRAYPYAVAGISVAVLVTAVYWSLQRIGLL